MMYQQDTHGARKAWHCGLTIRDISSRGHTKVLFLAAQAASTFCMNAGKAEVHLRVCTKQTWSPSPVPCVAVLVSGVSLLFPKE